MFEKKKFIYEMPEAYTAEKMTVKKGDYIIHDERDAGGYGFSVVHFDDLDELKAYLKERYLFDYFDDYGDALFCERTMTAAGDPATDSDFKAYRQGKICLWREYIFVNYLDFYTQADVEKMHWRRQYALENAVHCNN
jgi:hypothetical protein